MMETAASWQGANIGFWIITVVVLISAVIAATSRDILRAAYSLFFTLIGMAGYYVLLGSGFVAITQVIIYVGGILVLLMFGVLLTNRPLERVQTDTLRRYGIAAVAAVLLFGMLGHIILQSAWLQSPSAPVEPVATVNELGDMLLADYLIVLELAGMTLLLCLLGAAYLVRRRERIG